MGRSARDAGLGVVLSFAEIEGDVDILDADIPHASFEFDPLAISVRGLLELRRNVIERRIRYAYITDLPTWHWLYALLRLWGVKRVVTHSHISVASPVPPVGEVGLRREIKRRLNTSTLVGSDRIFTCSEFVKDRLVRKGCCPPERVSVFNYGLPDGRFVDPETAPTRGDGPVRIFCAGRATRVKGIQFLITATEHLSKRDLPDFEVSFAGTGPDLDEFKRMVVAAGLESRFRFLGYITDTTAQLREADIVVIPSDWGDAFPYAVLEALAAGKAVVATRAGGIPEQIGEGGCGVLVPTGDALALADALDELIRAPEMRSELGAGAYARARAMFREKEYFDVVVENLFEAFELAARESAGNEP